MELILLFYCLNYFLVGVMVTVALIIAEWILFERAGQANADQDIEVSEDVATPAKPYFANKDVYAFVQDPTEVRTKSDMGCSKPQGC